MSLSNLHNRTYGVPAWVCYIIVFFIGMVIGAAM